jgi:UDP-glucuronate 4-epimerase
MPRHVLITGAAGFIGSHASVAFLRRGDRVTGLDNFDPYYDPARKRANVREIAEEAPGAPFELVEGDLRDRALMMRLFAERRFDAVVHLAAMAGVRASVADPVKYYDVNLGGTLTLLDAARAHDCRRFVYASTSSVYGATKRVPFQEDDPADRPLAPYAASKRSAELLGYSYHHLHGLCFTALRFFTVYGPRGRPDMLTYKLIDALRTGEPLELYDGGRMTRDWTFVTDTVQGIVGAVDAGLGYEVINLGRGEPVLVTRYLEAFQRVTGRIVPYREAPRPEADVDVTHADITKAQKLLGYTPKVSVDEGARRSVEWYEKSVARLGTS